MEFWNDLEEAWQISNTAEASDKIIMPSVAISRIWYGIGR